MVNSILMRRYQLSSRYGTQALESSKESSEVNGEMGYSGEER